MAYAARFRDVLRALSIAKSGARGLIVPHLSGRAPFAVLLLAAVALNLIVWTSGDSRPSASASAAAQQLSLPLEDARPADIVPPPLLVRPITREAALDTNQQIPFEAGPAISAQPFRQATDGDARERALECLTAAIYYEAAVEPHEGRRAVAQVVLNRVQHPAFPSSVCAVVFQGSTRETGCQFTFTCDGSLLRAPNAHIWREARQVAQEALAGSVFEPVGLATHYHADYVVPYWATSLSKHAAVGRHLFYRWRGSGGHPAAFRQRYSTTEHDPRVLRAAALMVDRAWSGDSPPLETDVVSFSQSRDLELMSVIALLATARGDHETPYQQRARKWFTRYGGHPAVLIFRDLQQGRAVLARKQQATPGAAIDRRVNQTDPVVLSAYVASFALQSGFDRFLAAQKPTYRQASVDSKRAISAAAAAWYAYTGIPVKPTTATLSAAPLSTRDLCLARRLMQGDAQIVRTSAVAQHAAGGDLFVEAGLSNDLLANARRPRLHPAIDEQIVRAVFARIAALSQGEQAGERVISDQVARGHKSLPTIAAKLRRYEALRGQYRTLQDFLPVLLETAKRGDGVSSQGAAGPIEADCR